MQACANSCRLQCLLPLACHALSLRLTAARRLVFQVQPSTMTASIATAAAPRSHARCYTVHVSLSSPSPTPAGSGETSKFAPPSVLQGASSACPRANGERPASQTTCASYTSKPCPQHPAAARSSRCHTPLLPPATPLRIHAACARHHGSTPAAEEHSNPVTPGQLHPAAPASAPRPCPPLPQDQARLRRHVHHQHGRPGGHAAAGALLGGCCCALCAVCGVDV